MTQVYPDISDILQAKQERRLALAALSWEEKVVIIEQMQQLLPRGQWKGGVIREQAIAYEFEAPEVPAAGSRKTTTRRVSASHADPGARPTHSAGDRRGVTLNEPEDVRQEQMEDVQDELRWDSLFARTQPQSSAAARRAKQEIAAGKPLPMDTAIER